MSRMFSLISVHGIENGVARLSQQHYNLSKDDDGIGYKTDSEVRRIEINIRKDETRQTLDQRLNRQDSWIINMEGKLEKTDKCVEITDMYDGLLDD
jgi:hypothetical protein